MVQALRGYDVLLLKIHNENATIHYEKKNSFHISSGTQTMDVKANILIDWGTSIRFGGTRNSQMSLKSITHIWIQIQSIVYNFGTHRYMYVQKLSLMFTKDLPVQISFLSVKIQSNGFGICSIGQGLACPIRKNA